MSLPNCPKCNGEYTYEDGHLFICPECFHEWTELEIKKEKEKKIIRDSVGNELKDGDDVIIIKDLKVKGESKPLKQGTKVKSIVLQEEVDGHDIGCKIPGFGAMNLKSEVVKKI